MPVQFIRVKFPTRRKVHIDGQHAGLTGQVLRVGQGTHTINLGDPRNYTPKWRRPTVVRTNPLRPMVVTFEKE